MGSPKNEFEDEKIEEITAWKRKDGKVETIREYSIISNAMFFYRRTKYTG